ncbi:MAG: protein of unknown function with transrane region [Candidatus Adlerbacteria bacterium]|nr:protein of unknown function with transrane region [Candidatus Adlerbacteria bacterium]
MDSTPSVNPEYIFAHAVDSLLKIHFFVDLSAHHLTSTIFFWMETIGIFGMVLTVLLVVLVVYVRIRTHQVEHGGFHHLEHEEHARHAHTEHVGTNSRWDTVVALVNSPNDGDWRRAILEADVMLAQLLSDRGYPGDTLGEQLKHANPLQFTTINLAWEAHKMRNTVAHLGEAFPLTERDAKATIELYRRVFEEFGIL